MTLCKVLSVGRRSQIYTFWLRAGLSILNGRLEAERASVSAGQGYIRVCELHYWHFWYPWIAQDLLVQFKLLSGIRAWTHVWVYVQTGSSDPHCTKWTDDQHSPGELDQGLAPDLTLHTPPPFDLRVIHLVSSPVCLSQIYTFRLRAGLSMFNGRLEAEKPLVSAGAGYLWVGELYYWHLWHTWITPDRLVQFNI